MTYNNDAFYRLTCFSGEHFLNKIVFYICRGNPDNVVYFDKWKRLLFLPPLFPQVIGVCDFTDRLEGVFRQPFLVGLHPEEFSIGR